MAQSFAQQVIDTRAQPLKQSLLLSAVSADPSQTPAQVGGVIIWNLNYQMIVPQTDEKWGFAVLRSDFSARPAFSALANMPKP